MLEIPADLTTSRMAELLTFRNDDVSKIVVDDYDDTNIDGYYVSKVKKNEIIFNFGTSQLEHTVVERSMLVKFNLNSALQLLICVGNVSLVNQMITQISICFDNRVTVDAKQIDLAQLVSELAFDKSILLKKARINEIILENGVLANCTFEFDQYENAMRILEKNKDRIAQICVYIPFQKDYDIDGVSCTIYKSGSLIIHTAFSSFSEQLKKTIYRLYSK